MDKDKALRLALKTLEYAGPSWIESRQPAITAIKVALEAKDESVAWGVDWGKDGNSVSIIKRLADGNIEVLAWEYAPSSQRTWVGLTDEDEIDWEEGGNLKDLVKAIEAKLKDKNNG